MTNQANQDFEFDVTTPANRKLALDLFSKYGWVVVPHYWLVWQASQAMRDTVARLTAKAVEKETEAQMKAAVEIIKAGKKAGVDELEIAMDEKAGLGLQLTLKEFPLEMIAGAKGKMVMKVKYKDQPSQVTPQSPDSIEEVPPSA
jgi:hypothetical protein